mmetsp:Transcript_35928/g.73849  ORF Transcript_35928/g.73849 Transcript_35928/m.73849 type:complete len:94 (+) Transcript_35928:1350-1631(+)
MSRGEGGCGAVVIEPVLDANTVNPALSFPVCRGWWTGWGSDSDSRIAHRISGLTFEERVSSDDVLQTSPASPSLMLQRSAVFMFGLAPLALKG